MKTSLVLLSFLLGACGSGNGAFQSFGLKSESGESGSARLTEELEPLAGNETPPGEGDSVVEQPAEGEVNSPENQQQPLESLPMYLSHLLPRINEYRIYQVSVISEVDNGWEFNMGDLVPDAVQVRITAASESSLNIAVKKSGEEIWSSVREFPLTDDSYDASMFRNLQLDIWRQVAFHIWPITYPNELL